MLFRSLQLEKMKSKAKKNHTIVFIMFSNPEHDLPAFDSISLLSKEYKVVVIHRNSFLLGYKYPENVIVHKIGKRKINFNDYNMLFHEKIIEYFLFLSKIISITKDKETFLILCYNMHAFILGTIANQLSRKLPIYYYQNETILLSEISKCKLFYWLKVLEVLFVRFIDKLIFPEPNRAKLFLKDAKIHKNFLIVENCPRKIAEPPLCHPFINKVKSDGHRIVLHRGPIGKSEGIDIYTAIRSIKYWPSNAIFLILGKRTDEEENICKNLAEEEGVKEKVIFIPFVINHEELIQYTASADIGLVLYKPNLTNRKYVAPGKLYSYFACSVPVIVPSTLPYISKMINELGVGFSYSESTPESIGKTVSKLLNHPNRKAMGEKARKEHLTRLNFETQFQPVMDEIRTLLIKDKT